jgi:MFS family permease
VAFALSVLPLLVVTRFVSEVNIGSELASEAGPSPTPSARRNQLETSAGAEQPRPTVVPFVGLGFLIAATAEMLNGLFPVLATEYAGLSKAQAGIVYAVSTCVTIFSGPIFGWLSDNVSRKLVLLTRGVANTLSSVLYVVAPTFAGVGVAKTVDDMGKAAFRPAWGALMAQISSFDRQSRARTMSWMGMGEDGGGVVAPVLAGFLWNTWGISALMGTRVVLAIIVELYAIVVTRSPSHAGARRSSRSLRQSYARGGGSRKRVIPASENT